MRSTKLLAAVGGLALVAQTSSARAELLYGLLNNDTTAGQGQRLVTIDSTTRAVTSTVMLATPSAAGSLASIDVQPSTGMLYGFSNGTNQLYTVNPTTGALTTVGAPLSQSVINGGTIDFNPTSGGLRLIGTLGTNQNLRVDAATGTVSNTDPSLTYASGDVNAGATPIISGVGYTNSVGGATSTTLYDVDTARDILAIQNPNAGTLTTVGGLGFDAAASGGFGTFSGFDISGQTGIAYLSDSPAGTPPFFGGPSAVTASLYTVNLATGAATALGNISGLPFGRSVVDLAVAVPEPASIGVMVVAAGLLARRRRQI